MEVKNIHYILFFFCSLLANTSFSETSNCFSFLTILVADCCTAIPSSATQGHSPKQATLTADGLPPAIVPCVPEGSTWDHRSQITSQLAQLKDTIGHQGTPGYSFALQLEDHLLPSNDFQDSVSSLDSLLPRFSSRDFFCVQVSLTSSVSLIPISSLPDYSTRLLCFRLEHTFQQKLPR